MAGIPLAVLLLALLHLLLDDFAGRGAAVRHLRHGQGKTRLIIKYRKVGMCEDREHGMRVYDSKFELDDEGQEYVTSVMELKWPWKTIKKLKLTINRCSGDVAPNLCEYFTQWSFDTALCQLVGAKHMIWSPTMDSISPRLACPGRSGNYSVTRANLDLIPLDGPALGVELDKFIWVANAEMWNEKDTEILCMHVEMDVKRVKVKQKN